MILNRAQQARLFDIAEGNTEPSGSGGADLASSHFADAKCLQPGLAVFALCAVEPYAHKQKHRSAFQIPAA